MAVKQTKIDLKLIKSLGGIEFLAKQVVEGFITGLHKSPYHGFSVEFAEHRQYNTGESTRYLDWKVYNKTDRLFIKRFEEETNLRCSILLDISSSMYYPVETNGKLNFSVLAAAAIAYMLQKQRDAVSLTTFNSKVVYQSQTKSTSLHLRELFSELERTLNKKSEKETTSAYKVIDELAEKIHKRSLVVIFSDMFENFNEKDNLFNALKHLKHNQHEVLIFHVKDKMTEDDFAFDDKPYVFIDVESGERVKLNPVQIREYYKQTVQQFSQDLKIKCGQYKIDYIEVDINLDFKQVLLPFLLKRGKMI